MADKKTGLGMLALIGLGVWYFLIRKPSQGEHSVEVGLTWNPGGNPTFDCGKPRTANITVTNPTEWDWEYEIFLSCDAAFHRVNWPSVAVRAGQTVTITLSPGTTQVVESPSFITYVRDNVEERRVIVEVWYEDVLLAQELFTGVYYVKPEPVISPSVSINSLAWSYV